MCAEGPSRTPSVEMPLGRFERAKPLAITRTSNFSDVQIGETCVGDLIELSLGPAIAVVKIGRWPTTIRIMMFGASRSLIAPGAAGARPRAAGAAR